MFIIIFIILFLICFCVFLIYKNNQNNTNLNKKTEQNSQDQQKILELEFEVKLLQKELEIKERDFNQKLQNEIEKEQLKFEKEQEIIRKDKENQETLMKRFQENFENTIKQLKEDTTKIASATVHDSREKAIEQSKQIIETLINPLDKNIAEFKEKFIQNEESFKTQIGQMSIFTNRLAKIFQDNIKNQGIWGEEIVEKMFEIVGLKEGSDYYKEKAIGSEDGKRPDFIMNLRNDNHIVIDAKVSFRNWEEYIKSKEQHTEEAIISQNLINFLQDIKNQIKGLSNKEYEKISFKKTNNKSIINYVIMFIPVESMFMEIINNSDLFDKALEKNVIIVSRASLMPALFLVKEIINRQKQTDNLQEIIKLAEAIYDRFRRILKNTEDVEISLLKSEKQIQESKEFLEKMKKRILGETLIKDLKRMKSLGVNGDELPNTYINDNNEKFDNNIEDLIENNYNRLEDKKDSLL